MSLTVKTFRLKKKKSSSNILLEKDTGQPVGKVLEALGLGQQRANPASSVAGSLVGEE